MVRAVPCQLNGREWGLRLDMGAMAALEDHGVFVDDVVQALSEDWKRGRLAAKQTRFLLWAMLQGEDSPPTLQEVGRWVDGDNYTEVSLAVGAALKLAFPEKPKAKEDPERPLSAGTGANSSGSPTVPSPSSPSNSGSSRRASFSNS